ncbi:MAG: type II secretion system protein GspL [Pseudomonadota bacterium]|nr:type II secretion system protein GspL [Pseudomonadota bacterium]
MTTLYIRLPARADGDAALARFALVADGGAIDQQGEGMLRGLGDLVAASRRVVLLLAAADVTMLQVKAPPLSAARLKAALPSLVEEQVLGDPAECVLAVAPAQSADGLRSVAVVQRAYLEPLVRAMLALGARAIAALPAQLCLPLLPGHVSAAVSASGLTLRDGLYHGLGLAMASTPEVALQTLRALAGDAPLTLYLPTDELGLYQALSTDAGPTVTLEADAWQHWIAGSKTTTLDLVPALGAAGARARDWRRWRWPLGLAALAVIVNLVGINVQWLRMKHEADAIRLANLQTYRAAYPKDTVIQDPVLQMRANLARARAAGGQLGPDEFPYLAAAFGEAARALPRPLGIVALDYRERVLSVKVKPESADPGVLGTLKAALAARGLSLEETAPATWLVRNTGAKP